MLGRAERHAPADSPLRTELREVSTIAQETLDKVRMLSQALHPVMLEEAGLEATVSWYVANVEKQTGLSYRLRKNRRCVSRSKAAPRFTSIAFCRKR